MNNLQARQLANFGFLNNSKTIAITEPIEIGKSVLKNLQKDSWIEIESQTLKAWLVENSTKLAKLKLSVDDNYLYAKTKFYKKERKFKDKTSKESFNLKFDAKIVNDGKYIIDKLPIFVKITSSSRELAYAELLFEDKFYLNIKEIL